MKRAKKENVENIDIEACYEKYAPMIFRRCLGILGNEDDALDAAQDVFVKLLHNRKRLHGQFLSSLLYTIATNTCLNRLRQRKHQSLTQVTETMFPAEHDPEYEKVEVMMIMDAILRNESESTRAICFMYHRDNMTLREIGELTGLSVSGVRKRLLAFNARAKFNFEGGNGNE
ncbi:MAG: RNA polymerase sigma factor [Treponema sp.]|jgi:RNA polymerase sigma-70 factor (ECF subfamily)|nr:RNA polymerase sigma factor [Treponema sp.]